MKKGNNILKEAGVLLVIAILIATSFTANVGARDENKLSVIEGTNLTKNVEKKQLDGYGTIAGEQTIIDEDFEDPWEPDSNGDLAPYIWEMEHSTTETNGFPCWWHQYEETGENYAGLWWGYYPQDEWLMTRSFDLSVYTKATLEFLTWNYGFSSGHWEGDFVEVSIDGGSNWDILANLYDLAPPGDQFFGELMSFDLTPYCGESSVIVAFHRLTEDPNTNYGWWMIDDVFITAEDMIPIVVFDIKSVSGGFGVTAELENVGTGDATDVEWSISLEGGLILLGGKEGMVSIASGATETVKTGLVLGFGITLIKIIFDDLEDRRDAFILGPFVLGVKATNWKPCDNFTINWRQCTVTVNAKGVAGKHSVQFLDNDGNIIAAESGWDFGTSGSATDNVATWIKNKLRFGGGINVKT